MSEDTAKKKEGVGLLGELGENSKGNLLLGGKIS